MGFTKRLQHAWNILIEEKDDFAAQSQLGVGYGVAPPSRLRLSSTTEKNIVGAIYNRLAVDFAGVMARHVLLDEKGRYKEEVKDGLNNCLTLDANLDQSARAFKQDIALTLFDKGAIAVVPVDTTLDPDISNGYDILSMRVGYITKWLPQHIRVSVWNEVRGRRQEVTVEKRRAAIFENPFYAIMNEPNSTVQRLIRKLNILDAIDEQSGSGKLDLIIQLPYSVKTDLRRQQAEKRRSDIEFQLKGSKYGIAYTDGTEKITQLNRPSENNLLTQIQYLTDLLYSQLGLTPDIMNGTASEATMVNYMSRTIEPILDVVYENMNRSFLTKTARTRGHAIRYYRDPFKLVPISNVAEIADKFTRNEILSANEVRSAIGMAPSSDAKADELRNSNMPAPSGPDPNAESAPAPPESGVGNQQQEGDYQNGT